MLVDGGRQIDTGRGQPSGDRGAEQAASCVRLDDVAGSGNWKRIAARASVDQVLVRQLGEGVSDTTGSLIRGSKLASPAKRDHSRSLELPVTVGRLWARCGHGMGLGPESAVRRTVTPYACALAITIRLAHALLPVIWCSTATSR